MPIHIHKLLCKQAQVQRRGRKFCRDYPIPRPGPFCAWERRRHRLADGAQSRCAAPRSKARHGQCQASHCT
eukprot:5822887-Lingulodinium_polyedra.AAC.1